jgi:hypothetical protein
MFLSYSLFFTVLGYGKHESITDIENRQSKQGEQREKKNELAKKELKSAQKM